jgi:hypothetical protein
LYGIYFRYTPTHPVATIPLEPTAFVRIPRRITEKSVIVIVGTPRPLYRRRPSVLPPHGQRLTGFDAKQIASRIHSLWRQPTIMESTHEPFHRKLACTVVEIAAFKDAEHQHLSRCEIGCESKVTWFGVQRIGISI